MPTGNILELPDLVTPHYKMLVPNGVHCITGHELCHVYTDSILAFVFIHTVHIPLIFRNWYSNTCLYHIESKSFNNSIHTI